MNGDKKWYNIIATITIQAQGLFFDNGIETEASCEKSNNCTVDEYFYKGLLARDATRGTTLVSNGAYSNQGYMKTSAEAAVATCGQTGEGCALDWLPGSQGAILSQVGAEYSTLQVLQANIAGFVPPPTVLHPTSISSSFRVNMFTMMICLSGILWITV
jgi:mannan endo-1,6-alpha-mannosidase